MAKLEKPYTPRTPSPRRLTYRSWLIATATELISTDRKTAKELLESINETHGTQTMESTHDTKAQARATADTGTPPRPASSSPGTPRHKKDEADERY